jgi:hypothetical protein
LTILYEQGYLILAVNTNDVDYVACARVLAKSIKVWHPDAKVCLLTDTLISDPIFDIVKLLPYGDIAANDNWKLSNDWQVFQASPFRQTIKLEADMLITAPINHWWAMLEKRDVVISRGCRNFTNAKSNSRYYRKAFDQNNLPDVYNAITYWRLSNTAQQFFELVRTIFNNWAICRTALVGVDSEFADTDLVYAMAAKMIGVELVTLPELVDFVTITHMKKHHNNCETNNWLDQLVWEFDDGQIRINTIAQEYPFHYHEKTFAKLIEPYYDKLLGSR